jgi:hypothetical protein
VHLLAGCHSTTTCRAIPATFFAISHSIQAGTALGAGFTHISTKAAVFFDKFRTGKLQVCRSLANLCAIDHESEMARFYVLTAGFKTMLHGGLQASLIALRASVNAGLHSGSRHYFAPC